MGVSSRISQESNLGGVGDVDTGIGAALEDTEDSGTSRGSGKTGIQVASE